MGVGSFLEFLTMHLSWILYARLWGILVATGLVFFPIVVIFVSNIKESYKGGDDEGNAAVQSLKKIEADVFIMILVVVFAGVPLLDVSLAEMSYTRPALECNTTASTVRGDNTNTNFDRPLTAIGGQTGRIPLWWAVVHVISKSVTAASIAAIPCAPDFASVEFRLADDSIEPPELRLEVERFTDECWRPSKGRLIRNSPAALTATQSESTNWLGSEYFLATTGYYNSLQSSKPMADFPFNATRDSGLEHMQAQGGFPLCTTWWAEATNGLRAKVLAAADTDLKNDMIYSKNNLIAADDGPSSTLTRAERENIFLRKYLSLQRVKKKLSVDMPMSVGYHDYAADKMQSAPEPTTAGGQLGQFFGGMWGLAKDAAQMAAAGVGAGLKAPAAIGEGYMIRQGIAMVQPLILMLVVILLPFLLLIGMFRLQTVMTLTIIMFGLHFLSFIWAVAYYLDNNLFSLMESASGQGAFLPYANPVQSGILKYLSRFFYLVFPALYMAAVGWVGVSAGGVTDVIKGSGKDMGDTGKQGGAAAAKMASGGKL